MSTYHVLKVDIKYLGNILIIGADKKNMMVLDLETRSIGTKALINIFLKISSK